MKRNLLSTFAALLAATAALAEPAAESVTTEPTDDTSLGVTANGVDISNGTGAGWRYSNSNLTIDGSVPVTLSGTQEDGLVRVVVSFGKTATIAISNLCLKTSSGSIFTVGISANVTLLLAGENTLESGENYAGISVLQGASLTVA